MLGRVRLKRSIRGSDVFLVTYPKSGTNWVGFFLASIVAERESGEYDGFNLATYRDWVPDINREYTSGKGLSRYEDMTDPRIFTVHATYDPDLPRVIYLVRDPRAVMVSYYWHHRRVDDEMELSIEEFVDRNDVWPGDWADHVSGWLDHRDGNVLTVRYEDLQRDPDEHFERIVQFTGLEPRDQLDKYIEFSSFDNMAEAEPKREKKDVPFMRRGATSSWEEELPRRSVELIEHRYGDLMDQLGYEKQFA